MKRTHQMANKLIEDSKSIAVCLVYNRDVYAFLDLLDAHDIKLSESDAQKLMKRCCKTVEEEIKTWAKERLNKC